MPKSRNRLSKAERAYRNAHRTPADMPTGSHTMGRLVNHSSTPIPEELKKRRAEYNKIKRGPPVLVWNSENKGPFVGSIRATFTGARRNNQVASVTIN